MAYEYVFRSIIIGDINVGKTSICQQFCNNKCPTEHESTIGVDFFSKMIGILDGHGKKHPIKLQLWDMAGADNFKSITRSYYRNTALVFIVYDCTQWRTFKNVLEWIRDVQSVCDPSIIITLIHNKNDLHLKSQVDPNEAKIFAEERGLLFAEISSKLGIGVDSCFLQSVQELYKRIKAGTVEPLRLGIRHTELDGGLNVVDPTPHPHTLSSSRLCNHCVIM